MSKAKNKEEFGKVKRNNFWTSIQREKRFPRTKNLVRKKSGSKSHVNRDVDVVVDEPYIPFKEESNFSFCFYSFIVKMKSSVTFGVATEGKPIFHTFSIQKSDRIENYS